MEGEDLKAYLQQLFWDLEGPDRCSYNLVFLAFRVGRRDSFARSPRDILSRFSDWESKVQVLELINQNPDLELAGSHIQFFFLIYAL